MKAVFIFVVLISANLYFCLAGKQKLWADPKQPIHINVYGNGCQKAPKGEKGDAGAKGDKRSPCQCSLQDDKVEKREAGAEGDYGNPCQNTLQNPNKPSAHIEAANKYNVTYQAHQTIKDWSVSNTYSHLCGGMKYHDGKLIVPTTGRYYIYLLVYYHSAGRNYVKVNNKVVTMIQSPSQERHRQGTLYTGGVFNLKADDVITITSATANYKIYMSSLHTYFGAYLI